MISTWLTHCSLEHLTDPEIESLCQYRKAHLVDTEDEFKRLDTIAAATIKEGLEAYGFKIVKPARGKSKLLELLDAHDQKPNPSIHIWRVSQTGPFPNASRQQLCLPEESIQTSEQYTILASSGIVDSEDSVDGVTGSEVATGSTFLAYHQTDKHPDLPSAVMEKDLESGEWDLFGASSQSSPSGDVGTSITAYGIPTGSVRKLMHSESTTPDPHSQSASLCSSPLLIPRSSTPIRSLGARDTRKAI